MVSVPVVEPVIFVALIVTEYTPALVGAPVMAPLTGSSARPPGRPDAPKPVATFAAWMVKANGAFTNPSAMAGLVITGSGGLTVKARFPFPVPLALAALSWIFHVPIAGGAP